MNDSKPTPTTAAYTEMTQTGRAVLYLADETPFSRGPLRWNVDYNRQPDRDLVVTDAHNETRFPVMGRRYSWHNFAGRNGRVDFWFYGPDEHGQRRALWHGYQIGDNNTIAHCRRTNRRFTMAV